MHPRLFPSLYKCIAPVVVSTLAMLFSISVSADYTEDTGQDIVVTVKGNPRSNAENVCLAVTFARAMKYGERMLPCSRC